MAAQSQAQKLPPEVLGIILQHACSPLEFPQSFHSYSWTDTGRLIQSRRHFSLATVSSNWRYAVYATPQLWTSAVLNCSDAQLLDLYVTGSRFLHLSLELHQPRSQPESQPLSGGSVLSKVAPKLKNLILVNLEDNTLDYLSTLEFPFLKRIGVVSKGYRRLSGLRVTSTPVLQHLSLHALPYFSAFHFELPWSSMTSLHFDRVPASICIQALYQCHNLIEFDCQKAYSTHDKRAPRTPLTLPYLKLFHWAPYNGNDHNDLFPYLRIPVLQSLQLGFEGPINDAWNTLFRKLPPTLRKLQFSSFHVRNINDIPYPTCLLEHVPSVRELVLDQCSRPFVDDVFAALSLSSYDDDQGGRGFTGDPVYLPNLETVVVVNFFPPLDEDVPDVTREMVKKRFAGRKEPPIFTISTGGSSKDGGGASGGELENSRMILVIED